jgi:hypothetical protein
MPGFVRSQEGSTGWGLPLETTALVLERGACRVVLCGVDTLGIQAPAVDHLRARVATAAGATPPGVLLNWNHTHRAPPSARDFLRRSGLLVTDGDSRIDDYSEFLFDQVVAVARDAAAALEPARVAWGVGAAEKLSVNRRDRSPNGAVVHGWREDGLLDRQVVSLQARRRDGTPIATLVCFGCHTVSVGMDVPLYSADYPGALRQAVRSLTGGEAVFFQGAGGNVNPLCAFCGDEEEARRMGERLALEAVHSLADRSAWPKQLVRQTDASLVPMINFRFEDAHDRPPSLACVEETVSFPLLPSPALDEARQIEAEYVAAARRADARDAGAAERFGLLYHAKWARGLVEDLEAGSARSVALGPVNAVRVGDGVIVSGPGEVFTEIGMAVKERSPGRPTLYCGYTNGAVSYFSTSEAFAEGGYESAFSNRTYGLPAPVAPECERLLVEGGVRLAETLFPERMPFSGDAWTATGRLPEFPAEPLPRPSAGGVELPDSAPPPG